ncbi:MAG: ABC transporter ATP-binding protein [Bdellovibrionales bacterium RIFOXYC1_FULL_54_43]|nr:MAG: ABC transporter ATP-binding protein [Bdellovibrionales bacterium RIFOXYC1_FULL_54_43]OFZ84431.1 MAG: ABC transporter ATP-binding protein [Bdellovibrionales bacterium RIFOXYD1_FULL_55_31]
MKSETSRGAVRLENVTKSFRGGRDQVLRGVSIDFPVGKLTYILGSSGAGKSVLLKHILGLLRPDSGHVWVAGKDLSTLRGRELARHRMVFGMLFQNAALFDDMSVFENVAFPLREHTTLNEKEIENKVTKSLSILGMTGGYDKLPNELSGGMRKRVGLARAIIREPSILLYDEPTTGLDPVTRTTVDELIETLKRELRLTSIVISHDIPSALLLADQIAFLNQGTIVFWGTPKEFQKAEHESIRMFLDAERRTVDAFQV